MNVQTIQEWMMREAPYTRVILVTPAGTFAIDEIAQGTQSGDLLLIGWTKPE